MTPWPKTALSSCPQMQVAAFTSGRKRVSKFDCLLLQHVLWQRPAEGPRIGDYILQQLGAEDDLHSAEYIFQGAALLGGPCIWAPRVQATVAEGRVTWWAAVKFSGGWIEAAAIV